MAAISIRSADQKLVRELNLSLILNSLHQHAPISRASLATVTTLNKSTVSSLIKELIDRHFVREVGLRTAEIGRPSTLLEINPEAGYIISAEIGVDFITIICTNFAADILWQHSESTRIYQGQLAILDRTIVLIGQAINAGEKGCPQCGLLGISVGIPGLVDDQKGLLLLAPNLGWSNVLIRDIMQSHFPNVPVFVDNEANMAALGEYYFGAAENYNQTLYLSAGVGLGGALLIDGRIFKGNTGFAGEFGHMTIEPEGRLCNCGNYGCWETLVSQAALFRYIEEGIAEGRYTTLKPDDHLTLENVVEAADAGDALALESLAKVGRYYGIGIASLINAINPELVLLGGILNVAGKYLFAAIQKELRTRTLRWNVNSTKVLFARHGSDACVLGGVALVYQYVLANPTNIVRPIHSIDL